MSIQKSNMHRAAKILIEQGKAASVKEAVGQLEKYRIAIAVGKEAQLNELSQIALLTAVNSASRVFMGGVYVVGLDASTPCVTNLSLEPLLCDAVREMGGILSASEIDVPTLVIGDVEFLTNSGSACRLSFGGWSGGIIPTEQAALPTEGSNPLSAVLAAALGVASCFRHLAGESKDFGSETSGISLFDPLSDWQSTKGPSTCLTPSSLWLLGLGHLGQAYAWTLASMRFRDARPLVYLQDFDPIEEANLSTGMLTSEINIGQMKTRVVSGWLEKRGFSTRIVEQMFSGQFVLGSTEPRILLGGLDNLEARRHLEGPGFDLIVDAGLSPFGGSYDSFTVKAFTGDGRASKTFNPPSRVIQHSGDELKAYEGLGLDACGMRQLADVAVGVPFVGVTVACLVLAETMRALLGMKPILNMAGSLRNIDSLETFSSGESFGKFPGYIELL